MSVTPQARYPRTPVPVQAAIARKARACRRRGDASNDYRYLKKQCLRSLFAGSDGGGRSWATIATLLQTALCRARHKQVYADRRTMPINEVFANVFGSIAASE
ncbi:hypothetical protein GHK43_01700 [Sinorhizobium meliloti]|nr:hypothetical protein [Sinorhizobium meliloti]